MWQENVEFVLDAYRHAVLIERRAEDQPFA
jgi:hypothetical protein